MNIGFSSYSLAVKDIKKSKAFYETLGFEGLPEGGSVEEKWLIMQNGETKIGLFQDMFPDNIITFNPENARAIHDVVETANINVISASKNIKDESGPCNFMIADPDGNQILFDQFE